jgi:quercetin dioxygenase-like cupin family protein
MYFDGEFRHIGTVDPQPLLQAVEALGEDAWHEYVSRQERFRVHRQTQSIPLLFDADMRHTDPTPWPRLASFEPVIEPVLEQIRAANETTVGAVEDGYFIRILLTRLSPDAYIPPHRDFNDTIMRSHRYHLAIRTNKLVEFGIADKVQHMAPGEIWEINNRKKHSVRNLSQEARVHLILDYVVPGEKVEDPDGVVIA